MEEITEEEFAASHEIDRMSELLENFYVNFGAQKNYVLIGMYVPLIPIALLANILVIVVIIKNDYMRSATNYFVINLSVADLLVTTMCMPIAISQAVSIAWLYTELMCKLFYYLQGVVVAASVFTITAMSVDRYFAIQNPIAFRRIFNRKSTIIVIVVIWLTSLSIFGPLLKAVKLHHLDQENITLDTPGINNLTIVEIFQPPSISICSEDLKYLGANAYLFSSAAFVLVYAIPGFIVLIMYSLMGKTLYARIPPLDSGSIEWSASSKQGSRLVRERKRVAWILLIVAVLFALCWLPYNTLRLLLDLEIISMLILYQMNTFFVANENLTAGGEWVADVLSYCLFLGHANSVLNPAVYCFMTRTFRRSITEILCWNRATKRKSNSIPLAVAQSRRSRADLFKSGNVSWNDPPEKRQNPSGSRPKYDDEYRMWRV